jgi:dihydrofolate reductase
MPLSLIVAISENRVIGHQGALPWHLRADLRRFRRLTMGHHLVMGRKTCESIGRPLPGRTSIVLTRQTSYQPHGFLVARDLDDALRLAAGDDEPFIIGGEQIYRLALPRVERLYWTFVHAQLEGDAFFPALDLDQWDVVEETHHQADHDNTHAVTFRILQRMRAEDSSGPASRV